MFRANMYPAGTILRSRLSSFSMFGKMLCSMAPPAG
jgi:hypothetical protein